MVSQLNSQHHSIQIIPGSIFTVHTILTYLQFFKKFK